MEQGGSGEWTGSKCQRSLNKRRLSIKDDSPTFSIRGTSIFGQSKCLTLRDVGESLWLIFYSKFIILINHIYLKPHMQLYSVLVKLLFFSHFLKQCHSDSSHVFQHLEPLWGHLMQYFISIVSTFICF